VKVTAAPGTNTFVITQDIVSTNSNFTTKSPVASGSNVWDANYAAVKSMKIPLTARWGP